MAKIIVYSGAGISAESGIPTFRDKNGLWENHKIDEVANYYTWKDNFELVHKFYNQRRADLSAVQPNFAHKMVSKWIKEYKEVIVITQNIDDLFERAGCTNVIHLHGLLSEMKCEACGHIWSIKYGQWDTENDHCANHKCNSQKGVKPNVVFFHENAPMYHALDMVFESLEEDDIFIVIGTMGNVVPIGHRLSFLPSIKILNNLEPTIALPNDVFDYTFFMPATQAVVEIDKILSKTF